MDPITVIVAAVFAGAAGGVTKVVSEEVAAAYGALKSALLSKFKNQPFVSMSIQKAEAEGETDDAKLAVTQAVDMVGAASDAEVVALAKKVLESPGVELKNAVRVAEEAVALHNTQKIDVTERFGGSAVNEVEGERRAKVIGTDQSITVSGLPPDLPKEV